MIEQVSAGIVVYCKTQAGIEYLILHYTAGHWDFAKGKLEPGENNHQAAMRELHEETGIKDVHICDGFIQTLEYAFIDFHGLSIHKTVHFFVGEVPSKPEIVLSKEHQDYVWLPFEVALGRLTYQNARNVLIEAHGFVTRMK